MTSGRSVSCWMSVIALTINSASSASGAPMFTSSAIAPPATCCSTSMVTRDRSPARSCCWNSLRPVGLIRSPMIANGWSSPMTRVLPGEEIVVCTCGSLVRRGLDSGGGGEGAATVQQFLRPDDGGGCIRRVSVGAHDVGVLLGDGGAADHHDDLISQPGLHQGVHV